MSEPEARCSEAATKQLSADCSCVTRNDDALAAALRSESGDPTFYDRLVETRTHLFSRTPVFLPPSDREAMSAIVRAIEAVTEIQGYRDAVHAWQPAISNRDLGPRGAFMGYDFHLGSTGPKLIEINTNAGGAFLNAFLARAQVACCAEVERRIARSALEKFDGAVIEMFEQEWRTQRGHGRPQLIAIVDDAPEEQYLYPEFVLAKGLFERHGIEAVVVDASALRYEHGRLLAGEAPVDLVYNRLVDFALEAPDHVALRAAYFDDAVVLTPNPRNHALYADKRNLTLLSDPSALRNVKIEPRHLAALRGVPYTVRVTRHNAAELWSGRKQFFFKPAAGHGGKAVYRGDKLTKSVWENIVEGDYVAQAFAPPSEQTITLDGQTVQRKLDVRLYTKRSWPQHGCIKVRPPTFVPPAAVLRRCFSSEARDP